MRRQISARWRGQRGQSLLETAIMIPVIFVVVFWVFEMGWLMYTYAVLADAANEGVRHSMVHSGGDVGGTETIVNISATPAAHGVGSLALEFKFPAGSAAPPNRVRVTVTYTYVPYLKSFMSPTMRTYAEGRMVVE